MSLYGMLVKTIAKNIRAGRKALTPLQRKKMIEGYKNKAISAPQFEKLSALTKAEKDDRRVMAIMGEAKLKRAKKPDTVTKAEERHSYESKQLPEDHQPSIQHDEFRPLSKKEKDGKVIVPLHPLSGSIKDQMRAHLQAAGFTQHKPSGKFLLKSHANLIGKSPKEIASTSGYQKWAAGQKAAGKPASPQTYKKMMAMASQKRFNQAMADFRSVSDKRMREFEKRKKENDK